MFGRARIVGTNVRSVVQNLPAMFDAAFNASTCTCESHSCDNMTREASAFPVKEETKRKIAKCISALKAC